MCIFIITVDRHVRCTRVVRNTRFHPYFRYYPRDENMTPSLNNVILNLGVLLYANDIYIIEQQQEVAYVKLTQLLQTLSANNFTFRVRCVRE